MTGFGHRPAEGVMPRLAAMRLLAALDNGQIDTLDEGFSRLEGMPPADAALARELATGAVAWERLYDHLSDRFLRGGGGGQPTVLRYALRIAAHQLYALDRVPDYAIGSATVAALAEHAGRGLTGVANAVIRKLADLRSEFRTLPGPLGMLDTRHWPADLGVRYGLPAQLIADLGEDATGPQLAALTRRAPLATRTRPGAPAISGRSIVKRDGDWIWWDDPQEAIQGPVADGRAVVQDRSQGHVAELAARVARIGRGDLVLDLCAAPGGKSLALRDLGCRVVSADARPAKVGEMPAYFTKLVQDGAQPALAAAFDLVVVDAPCSNSGVLARRPEARRRYDTRHRDLLVALQTRLLAAAATLCAPGGRLLYATCSVTPQENQGIAHTLAGWRVLGEQRTWPDAWQAGGYAAVLVRA